MKIGLMQGRLSKPTNGHIQEFPEEWEDEFPEVDVRIVVEENND